MLKSILVFKYLILSHTSWKTRGTCLFGVVYECIADDPPSPNLGAMDKNFKVA